jgi:multiple sugar transport system substrate-binding protein
MRTQPTRSGGAQITYDFLPLLYAYGGTWFRAEGTDWTPAVDSPEAVRAATVMRQLVQLGPAETSTIGQAQVIGAMQAGEALQVHVVAAAAPGMLSEADSNVVDRVGFAVLPAGSTGKPGVASGTWALGVPAGLPPERATAALNFIKWVQSKPAQTRFTELGGIPTRSDALDGANISDGQRAYLEAVNESLPYVGKHVRYEFSAEMLPITERHLAEIAAGKVAPPDGMSAMQQELTELVRKYGYPMSAG